MLGKDPAAAAIFLREGEPLKTGEKLVQADLADTLEEIESIDAALKRLDESKARPDTTS